jgi:hypothetical protein
VSTYEVELCTAAATAVSGGLLTLALKSPAVLLRIYGSLATAFGVVGVGVFVADASFNYGVRSLASAIPGSAPSANEIIDRAGNLMLPIAICAFVMLMAALGASLLAIMQQQANSSDQ